MSRKTNYFYIDEAGHVNNNSNVFIHGCIKTDSPFELNDTLNSLIKKIENDIYNAYSIEKFIEQGFHAVENHPDIRAEFYRILPVINYRSYFVVLNKNEVFFENFKNNKQPHEIFALTLNKLLRNRIERAKNDKNIFYFEQIELGKVSLDQVIKDFFDSLGEKKGDCEYYIVGKNHLNLSIIDYLNYIFFSILEDVKKKQQRMIENFELIKPKIGSINYINRDAYFSRKQGIDINKIVDLFCGKA